MGDQLEVAKEKGACLAACRPEEIHESFRCHLGGHAEMHEAEAASGTELPGKPKICCIVRRKAGGLGDRNQLPWWYLNFLKSDGEEKVQG
jgi:hypothetical protein